MRKKYLNRPNSGKNHDFTVLSAFLGELQNVQVPVQNPRQGVSTVQNRQESMGTSFSERLVKISSKNIVFSSRAKQI
jgi:hypothetical protein